LGYVAFAADVYGTVRAEDKEEAVHYLLLYIKTGRFSRNALKPL